MGSEAIAELKTCIVSLGLANAKNKETPINGKIYVGKGWHDIRFTVNQSSPDYPSLDFDETIRGFKIPYTHFRPGPPGLDMSWDNTAKTLNVKGKGYEFDLKFSR